MNTIIKLLDEAQKITGSDRQTAIRMGYTPQELCRWRAAKRPVPVEASTKLARVLMRPPFQVVCEIECGQATTDANRKHWISLLRAERSRV